MDEKDSVRRALFESNARLQRLERSIKNKKSFDPVTNMIRNRLNPVNPPVNSRKHSTEIVPLMNQTKKEPTKHELEQAAKKLLVTRLRNCTFMYLDVEYEVKSYNNCTYRVGELIDTKEKKKYKMDKTPVKIEIVRICAFSLRQLKSWADYHNINFSGEHLEFSFGKVGESVGKDKEFTRMMFLDWKTEINYMRNDRRKQGREISRKFRAALA